MAQTLFGYKKGNRYRLIDFGDRALSEAIKSIEYNTQNQLYQMACSLLDIPGDDFIRLTNSENVEAAYVICPEENILEVYAGKQDKPYFNSGKPGPDGYYLCKLIARIPNQNVSQNEIERVQAVDVLNSNMEYEPQNGNWIMSIEDDDRIPVLLGKNGFIQEGTRWIKGPFTYQGVLNVINALGMDDRFFKLRAWLENQSEQMQNYLASMIAFRYDVKGLGWDVDLAKAAAMGLSDPTEMLGKESNLDLLAQSILAYRDDLSMEEIRGIIE